MANNRFLSIYRASIIIQSVLLPSALYGLSFVALALSFFCWIKFKDYKVPSRVILRPQILCAILLYIIVLIGFFFSIDFKEALSSLSGKLAFLLFPLIIGTASVIDNRLIIISCKFLIASIVISLLGAIVYAFVDINLTGESAVLIKESVNNKLSSYGLTRVFYNWHPTNVSLFANLAIASIFFILNSEKINKKGIGLYVTILLFLSICIFLLNSVAGILIYFLMLIYGLSMWFKRFRLRIVAMVIIILCLLFVVGGFFYVNPFKSDKLTTFFARGIKVTDIQGERNFVTIRLAKWDGYSAIIKEHWLLGTTEGNIKVLRKQSYLNKGYSDLAKYNYNAHNQYIEILATYGIVGLLLLFCLLLFPFFQRSYHPIYIPFVIIACVVFISESLLNRQQGISFFMFYYSLLTHFSFRKNN